MMSVLVYASVVRIAVWDGYRQSLLVGKLCHVGMATCHCGCHVIAALSRSGFASDCNDAMFRSHVGLCVCRVMICCYACRVMLSSLWLMSRCSCIWSSAVHCSQYPALTRHGASLAIRGAGHHPVSHSFTSRCVDATSSFFILLSSELIESSDSHRLRQLDSVRGAWPRYIGFD